MTEEKQPNVVEKEPNVDSLKAKLQEVNKKKEEWFTKKEELNKEIAGLIHYLKETNPQIKEKKQRENELRRRRDDCNKRFRESLEQSKMLAQDRKALYDKYGQITSPNSIEKKIEKIEYSIETQALSLDKEKKLMSQIKELKKILGETEVVGDYKTKMGEISKNIVEAKEEADKCHSELKEITKENRKKFKEYLAKSKRVNQLKKEQRQAFKSFVTYKSEFAELSKKLPVKVKITHVQIKKKKIKRPQQKDSNNNRVQIDIINNARIIDQRVKEVEKKMREKKKLTTQDIIAMQGKKE